MRWNRSGQKPRTMQSKLTNGSGGATVRQLQLDTEDDEAGADEIGSEKITRTALERMIEAQGYRCPLTGRQLEPETSSIDHKVPLARGGTHTLDNVWIIHRDANRAKSTMTIEEFRDLCRDVLANTGEI